MTQSTARIKSMGEGGQAIVEVGPLENVLDCELALRTIARAMAAGKDPKGHLLRTSIVIRGILWSKFQTKGLEIKGFNMDQADGQQTQFTTEDYADRYREAQAELRRQREEIDALQGKIAAMQGRERPRPPRPTMN